MAVMTVAADSAEFRFGTQCLKVTTGSTGNNAIYPALDIPVTPGSAYTFSAYIKTQAAITGGYIALRFAPGGSLTQFAESIAITDTSSSTDNGWQRIILSAIIPDGVFSVRPIIVYTGTTSGQVFWLDGVKHEPGGVASVWHENLVSDQAALDQMGLVIDGAQGGVFRLLGGSGGSFDTVSLGNGGLVFGSEIEVRRSSSGVLSIDTQGAALNTQVAVGATSGQRNFISMLLAGDSSSRLVLSGDATAVSMEFGPGNATRDIFIGRNGAKDLWLTSTAAGARLSRILLGGRVSLGAPITTTLSGTHNDWNPTNLSLTSLIRVTSVGASTIITGVTAGNDGDILYVINGQGTNTITWNNNSASSSTGNKVLTPNGANFVQAVRATVCLIYSATDGFWYLVGPVA